MAISLLDDYIECVHRMPWWKDIMKEEIRRLLIGFANSVTKNIEPWSPWNPTKDINPDKVITLGFVEKDNKTGELVVTERGRDVRKTIGWIFAICYDTIL